MAVLVVGVTFAFLAMSLALVQARRRRTAARSPAQWPMLALAIAGLVLIAFGVSSLLQ